MDMPILELEGLWEEIRAHDAMLSGHKVRLTVLDADEEHLIAPSSSRKDRLTLRELLNLPLKERDCILASQAEKAEKFYRNDPKLTDFEAFGEEDYYDETP